jgi:RNA polymerase sigma-70 factor, ECF subfamily
LKLTLKNNLTFGAYAENEKQFELLFKSQYVGLVKFAQRYVDEVETAEELVQDVFVNIWSNLEDIHIQSTIQSYLFGSVRNAALNYLKHQKVVSKYADNQRMYVDNSEHVDFLELDELKNRLAEAMNKIPEKCREIFELNRFEGKRYKEIAAELGISLKTVENQMGKALKILREELGEYLPLLFLFIFNGGKL